MRPHWKRPEREAIMRKLWLGLIVIALPGLVTTVFASNVVLVNEQMEIGQVYMFPHHEGGTFGGWVSVIDVQNIGGGIWGDFHIKIIGSPAFGTQELKFDDSMFPPQSSQNFTYTIFNNGLEIGFDFDENEVDRVPPLGIATFEVYFVNPCEIPFFVLEINPTPSLVPEPATLGLLAAGSLALLRRKR